jgi:predicted acylesterase/phospholipase RssA
MSESSALADDPFWSIRPFAGVAFLAAAFGCIFLNAVYLGLLGPPQQTSFVSAVVIAFLLLSSIMLGIIMILLGRRAASNIENVRRFEELSRKWLGSDSDLGETHAEWWSRRAVGKVGALITNITHLALVVAASLALFGCLISLWLALPLLEALASWLNIPAVHLLEGPKGLLEDVGRAFIPALVLLWPVQLLRPRRDPLPRSARILAAAVLATSLLQFDPFLRAGAADIAIILFALVLCLGLIWSLDAAWPQLFYLIPVPLFVPDVTRLMFGRPASHHHTQGNSSVGLALSGGGYRASLFALGSLLYIRDALASTKRRVVTISSVSGGSVTNALLAHGGGIEANDRDLDWIASQLVEHAIGPGSMFSGLWARAYYFLVLPVTGSAILILIWLALHGIPSTTYAYAVIIVVLTVASLRIFFFILELKPVWLSHSLQLAMLVGLVAGYAPMLAHTEWRQGLALIAGVATSIASAALIWNTRGRLLERTMEALFARVSPSAVFSEVKSATRHIICATEIQLGETVYFAQDAISVRGHDPYTSQLPTARLVRASAAFPLAFPPVIVNGVPWYVSWVPMAEGKSWSFGPQLSKFVLVDGGVRDNLGFCWFEEAESSMDELVVVSAAPNRYRIEPLKRVLGLSEPAIFPRIAFLPYNTRERLRRRMVASYLHARPWGTEPKAIGAIVHIEDSPFDLSDHLIARAEQGRGHRVPRDEAATDDHIRDLNLVAEQILSGAGAHASTLLERAKAAADHLVSVESVLPIIVQDEGQWSNDAHQAQAAWRHRVRRSISVKTTFGALDPEDAENLIVHGYYLTCANLHVTMNWPLLNTLNRERLARLSGGR